jgi:hypothetical protein
MQGSRAPPSALQKNQDQTQTDKQRQKYLVCCELPDLPRLCILEFYVTLKGLSSRSSLHVCVTLAAIPTKKHFLEKLSAQLQAVF